MQSRGSKYTSIYGRLYCLNQRDDGKICLLIPSVQLYRPKYHPFRRSRAEQECRLDGSSRRIFPLMRSRQEELGAAAQVSLWIPPAGQSGHEYLNRKETSSKHQSKAHLFHYRPQIWDVRATATSDEEDLPLRSPVPAMSTVRKKVVWDVWRWEKKTSWMFVQWHCTWSKAIRSLSQ